MGWLRINRRKDKGITDENLLANYQASHDSNDLEILFDRHLHLIYGVALKYLHDREQAQDATMQIFEKLIAYLKSNKIINFRSWLYSTTKNHCLMELRKRTATEKINNNYFMESEEYFHPIDEVDENTLGILEKCLELLNDNQKECVKRFYLNNNSYQQIADSTGYEIKNIKSYLQNGRRNLKQCMERNEEKAKI